MMKFGFLKHENQLYIHYSHQNIMAATVYSLNQVKMTGQDSY